mmetsp:Transcript_87288/g.159842  ORF Transcript_87288/g.159842 Transcript_87288/m.159842 type:complete len:180 (-) Transcript_87288:419-958(-)
MAMVGVGSSAVVLHKTTKRPKKAARKEDEEVEAEYIRKPKISNTENKKAMKKLEEKNREDMKKLVENNMTLKKVEGTLTEYARHGILGFGKESVRACWFELDPVSKHLTCWSSASKMKSPEKKLSLEQLADVDVNRRHRFMFLHFHNQSKWIHLQAETDKDFERWMSVFQHYKQTPVKQ